MGRIVLYDGTSETLAPSYNSSAAESTSAAEFVILGTDDSASGRKNHHEPRICL